MDVAIKRSSKDAGFAVIRNYAPARIERELLAQVFDIVQHREPLHVDSSAHSDLFRESTSTATTDDDSASNAHDNVRDDQRIAMEAAA
ncbi:MAG TPA: hypothetical protein VMM76_04635 [Pirellulaceae bacterium]|nr:hypothetical protein [Pirellulaceae bacterium]